MTYLLDTSTCIGWLRQNQPQIVSLSNAHILIATIVLANGCTLVTHNTAEFGRVPGLLIEDWQIA